MDTPRIAALLDPFLDFPLNPTRLDQTSTYIDLLLRWNARINLTAVRDPEEIITRHFGESFFLARHVFPKHPQEAPLGFPTLEPEPPATVVDLGSGAGFPGLPVKIWAPEIHLTLIESNHKKAAFLREVVRALTLTDVDVIAARAESIADQWIEYDPPDSRLAPQMSSSSKKSLKNSTDAVFPTPATSSPGARASITGADVVTFRAVEHFEHTLQLASHFLVPSGRLAILITATQLPHLDPDPSSQLSCRAPDGTNNAPTALRWVTYNVPQSHKRLLAVSEPIKDKRKIK